MPSVPLVSYNDVLKHAQDYYEHCAVGDNKMAATSLNKYFETARKMNPCTARMGLQQAQNDVFLRQTKLLLEETIDIEDYKQRKINLITGASNVNRDSRLSELEHRIRDFITKDAEGNEKLCYGKSYKKRLSLIPCIMDNEISGLSSIKYKKLPIGTIKDSEQIVENKVMKKIIYIMRKLLTK